MITFLSLSRFFETTFTFYVGGSPSPGPSTTNVQNSNLPEYVQPYVEGMLGSAQQQIYNIDGSGNISGFKPYTPYSDNPQDYFAGFSPLQNQSFQSAANLQVPGQFGAASGATMGAMGALANNQYNPMTASYIGANAPSLNQYSMQGPQNIYAPMARSAQLGNTPTTQASQMGPQGQVGYLGVGTQDFTSPGMANQYMNPYLNSALQPQLAEIGRQYDITGQQEKSQATGQGAFGGNRQALMQAENSRNKNTAMNTAIGQGYNTAFNNAQQQFNTQQNANLQAQQANQGAGIQTGLANQQVGYNTALQNAQLAQQSNLSNQSLMGQYGLQQGQFNQQANLANQQARLQAQQANQQAGLSTGIQNLQSALQTQGLGAGQNLQSQLANQAAYGNAQQANIGQQQFGANMGQQNLQQILAGAGQLGNLGTNQLAAQQGVLNTQNAMGAQQQQQEQGKINQAISNYATAQQYPMMQLGNMSNLLHGLPMSSTTTQTYQAAPSAISQFGALGTGLIGASKLAGAKRGGSTADISRRGGDGIDKISMHELMSYKE